MIAVCTPFYPWWRDFERTNELFDVLIASMLQCSKNDQLILSIVDASAEDIWGNGRSHNRLEFVKRIRSVWGGRHVYSFAKDAIHVDRGGNKRFWISRAVNRCVDQVTADKLFLTGFDIWLPVDFVDRFNSIVNDTTCWVPHPYHVRRGAPLLHDGGKWRTARGLTGILKSNYYKMGKTREVYINSRHDSVRFLNMCEKFTVAEHKTAQGFFHVDHPGGNEKPSDWKGGAPW